MKKEEKEKLKKQAFAYIYEDLKAGESQRVIDNVEELINQVEKRIQVSKDTSISERKLFAESFNKIGKGVLEVKQVVSAVKDINIGDEDSEALNLTLEILNDVLETISKKPDETPAEKMLSVIVSEVSKQSKK